MRKKKVLIQTDSAVAKTGFGRTAKALLTFLYKTDKYDIVHYSLGCNWSHPSTHKTPWKTIGCLPDSPKIQEEINKDPSYARQVGYGAYHLDKVVRQEKPDVYIAIQDIWGIDFSVEKSWFDKINSVIWTTLDSLPILPTAEKVASKVKNYWIWSSFATKAMHDIGHTHIKTVHGPVDCSPFRKLNDESRLTLRRQSNFIPDEAFVAGFVFRNQLRKSVPNLLEGYSSFKKSVKCESRLLLHTSFTEGWNIIKLAKENGVDPNEILTTYVCHNCKSYQISPYVGEKQDCKFCRTKGVMNTTNTGIGVSEEQLNEIYNLMDVYVHPFTSGGQEIPIQEAKLTELITLVTNYSCGEELCEDDAARSLPLDWSEYREHGTEFRKASTKPFSIAKQLKKVWYMKPNKRKQWGKEAREWTIKNYSIDEIGKRVEKFLDEVPHTDYDFSEEEEKKKPFAEIPKIEDDADWITWLYHNLLNMRHVSDADDGHKYWMDEISKGAKRESIENYFRKIALKENAKLENQDDGLAKLLSDEDKGRRILYVMPNSIGDVFLSTSLFRSIKELYPDYNLYVATEKSNMDMIGGNKYVYKVIPYVPQMDNLVFLEGHKDHEGYFEIAFLPYVTTQKFLTYLHNGKDKIAYKDLVYEN